MSCPCPFTGIEVIIKLFSLAKVQVLLNHLFRKEGVHIEVLLAFVIAPVNADWIICSLTNPGKI